MLPIRYNGEIIKEKKSFAMDIIECAYFRSTIYFEERKKMCVQWQKCEMVLSITLDTYVMKYVKLYALMY